MITSSPNCFKCQSYLSPSFKYMQHNADGVIKLFQNFPSQVLGETEDN